MRQVDYEDYYEDYKDSVNNDKNRKKHSFRGASIYSLSPVRIYADFLKGSVGAKPIYSPNETLDLKQIDSAVSDFNKETGRAELNNYLESGDTYNRSIGEVERFFEKWDQNIIAGSPKDIFLLFHINDGSGYNKRELFEKKFFKDFGQRWEKLLWRELQSNQIVSKEEFLAECAEIVETSLREQPDYLNLIGSAAEIEKSLETSEKDDKETAPEKEPAERRFLKNYFEKIYDVVFEGVKKYNLEAKDIEGIVVEVLIELREELFACKMISGKNHKQMMTEMMSNEKITSLICECMKAYSCEDIVELQTIIQYIDGIETELMEMMKAGKSIFLLPEYVILFECFIREILTEIFQQILDQDKAELCRELGIFFDDLALSKEAIAVAALKLNSLSMAFRYFEQFCVYKANVELNRVLRQYEKEVISKKSVKKLVLPKLKQEEFQRLIEEGEREQVTSLTRGFKKFKDEILLNAYDLIRSDIGKSAGFSEDSILDVVAAYNFLKENDKFTFPCRTKDKNGYLKGTKSYNIQNFAKKYVEKYNRDDYEPQFRYADRWKEFEYIDLLGFDTELLTSRELLVIPKVLIMYRDRIVAEYYSIKEELYIDDLMCKVKETLGNYVLAYDMVETVKQCAELCRRLVTLAYEKIPMLDVENYFFFDEDDGDDEVFDASMFLA